MYIVVDSTVWFDHISKGNPHLTRILKEDSDEELLSHATVLGELIMGNGWTNDQLQMHEIGSLPLLPELSSEDVMDFVRRNNVYGLGMGWADARILASVAFFSEYDIRIWTRDKGFLAAAKKLGMAYDNEHTQAFNKLIQMPNKQQNRQRKKL